MTEPVSPSEPLPQSDDPEFHSFTEEFEHRFFDGAEQVKVEITLMRETWDEVVKIIEANGWKLNEGLIIVLTTGMAYLKAERALTIAQGAAGSSPEELQHLLDRLMAIEARYASIKNFAFDVMRDHRALEIKHAPIEREYLTYKSMVWPLRRENDALKEEIARLRHGSPTESSDTDSAAPARQHHFWQGWLNALRNRTTRE